MELLSWKGLGLDLATLNFLQSLGNCFELSAWRTLIWFVLGLNHTMKEMLSICIIAKFGSHLSDTVFQFSSLLFFSF